ncbi:hypothetical protein [Acinetobacter sp. ANC 3781]|uniref:hypothetical protein n=1 Tax=Acinetobacter sp. ANC 3781 TaxID=2529835 RepID=UPI00202F216B|nr:hypothetical protein [Acinetobacter sp. ANC 3781]
MSESKQILKEQFIEHFLFDYTDKDEFEIQMLSEIFEGIYYQKDKHFKPESKYWQVFRCLQDQQAIINNLKTQLNNMEACYIGVKKKLEDQHKKVDEVLEYLDGESANRWGLWKEKADMMEQGASNAFEEAYWMVKKALRGE